MDNNMGDAMLEVVGHEARQLSKEEIDKLQRDSTTVSDYKRNKLEKEAKKNWDLFYKRNTTKFFKDRHWTKREFEELCGKSINGEKLVIFEVGCGVGNFIFPLIEEDVEKHLYFYACDFSQRAVQFVKENSLYDVSRCHAFQCDVTEDEISREVPVESVDIATLIFVLSAINPDKMEAALKNLHKVMKAGGLVLFRDYGLFDHAMLRFKSGHKISPQFYVRQDGTRAYYFTVDEVKELFAASGFEAVTCEYVNRQTVNKKEGLSVQRVFVQAKFKKISATEAGNQSPISNAAELQESLDTLSVTSKGTEEELEEMDSKRAKVSADNEDICQSFVVESNESSQIEEINSHLKGLDNDKAVILTKDSNQSGTDCGQSRPLSCDKSEHFTLVEKRNKTDLASGDNEYIQANRCNLNVKAVTDDKITKAS